MLLEVLYELNGIASGQMPLSHSTGVVNVAALKDKVTEN